MEGPFQYRNPYYEQINAWMDTEQYQLHSVEYVGRPEGKVPTDHIFVKKN